MIIAIDGPAASGKSTVAHRLADELGYLFFDTGVMYRAVTLAVLQNQLSVGDEAAVCQLADTVQIDVRPPSQPDDRAYDVVLNGADVTWEIRSPIVDSNVSQVSAYAGVRQAMSGQQRRIGLRGNVVMVGRDIGTVVLPEADLKIYMDASPAERARRRYQEKKGRDELAEYAEIYAAMVKRDQIDSNRAIAPLKPAGDAVIINTDGMSIDAVVLLVKSLIKG